MSRTNRRAQPLPSGRVRRAGTKVAATTVAATLLALLCPAGFQVAAGSKKAAPAQPPVAAASSPRDLALAGKRQLDAGKLDEALNLLTRARAGLASEPTVDRELADYLGLNLYNLGVRLNNERRFADALVCFRETLKLERQSRGVRDAAFESRLRDTSLSVAAHAVATGSAPAGAELYKLLLEIDEIDTRARCGLAAALLATGQPDAADAEARRVLIYEPRSAEAMAVLGKAALLRAATTGAAGREAAARQVETAVEWFRKAAEVESAATVAAGTVRARELGTALGKWSRALLRAGDLSAAADARREAETILREAASRQPESPWGWIDVASLLSELGRYQEAEPVWARVESLLAELVRSRPSDPGVPSWQSALTICRENRAVASYNLAVDAINSARFEEVAGYLEPACATGPQWTETCTVFRQAARAREEAFRRGVATHEQALRADANRAADLLALGQIYEQAGAFDRALSYYTKLASLGSPGPEMADRIASVSRRPSREPIEREVEIGKSHLTLVAMTGESRVQDVESGLKAAALRVVSVLGADALQGGLTVTVYANRRAFREDAGYRVGADVTGFYSPGEIRTFDVPSRTALDWVSVMTHELSHHAVERMSGGTAPKWLSEGMARYIEGDAGIVDRVRLRTRLDAGALQPLSRLDAQMQRGWNDPEISRDARDQALLAVEQMTKRKGSAALGEVLAALAAGTSTDAADLDAALRAVLGADLAVINAQWQAALPRPSS